MRYRLTKQEFDGLKPGDVVKFDDHDCLYIILEPYALTYKTIGLSGWRLQLVLCKCTMDSWRTMDSWHDCLVSSILADRLSTEVKFSHED